jgi:predicted enzyme related to lactoylglutathione lyase
MASAINWFEIPASNYERAVNFSSTVLGTELQVLTDQSRSGNPF